MKLYELRRGAKFRVSGWDGVYTLIKLDGMYSICLDEHGNEFYFAVMTPVEEIQ